MAYEIHLAKLADDLETEIPITREEWNSCILTIKDLKYVSDDFPESVQTYVEEKNEWIPVCWISSGSGTMRASGFFKDDITYSKATQIAEHLQAYIFGDESELYFIPGYGALYDKHRAANDDITLSDLKQYRREVGNAYRNNIVEIITQRKKAAAKRKELVKASEEKRQEKMLTVIGILLSVLCILYLILRNYL